MELKFLPSAPLALWIGTRASARSDEPLPDGKAPGRLRPAQTDVREVVSIAIRDRSVQPVRLQADDWPVVLGHIGPEDVPPEQGGPGKAACAGAALGLIPGLATYALLADPDHDEGVVVRAASLATAFGGLLGGALGFCGHFVLIHLREVLARRAEHAHVRREALTPQGQLDRIVALACRQPLLTGGLVRCIDRLRQLQALYPAEIPGEAVGRAIVRLAHEGALAAPHAHHRGENGFMDDLAQLFRGLRDLRSDGLLDRQACERLLLATGRGVLPPSRMNAPALQVATLLFDQLECLYGPADPPGGPHEGHLWRAMLSVTTQLGPDDDGMWGLVAQRLPGRGGTRAERAERILRRVGHVPGCPAWLLAAAVQCLWVDAGALEDANAYGAFTGNLITLARVHGNLNAHVLKMMVDCMVMGRVNLGGDQEAPTYALLRARIGQLARSQGFNLSKARVTPFFTALATHPFFAEAPSDEEIGALLTSLVSADTAPSMLHELLRRGDKWMDPALLRQALGRTLEAPAILRALRLVPAAHLAHEYPYARSLLLQGAQTPLARARVELQVLAVLRDRPDTPADVCPRGLMAPQDITRLVTEIAAQPASAANQDRGEVIARLMQMAQSATTERQLRHAVDTLLALPEYAPSGRDPGQDAARRTALLTWVLDACAHATLFISAQAEREAARREAGLAGSAEGQPVPDSAPIRHGWLTPDLIAELTAPLTKPREAKHG